MVVYIFKAITQEAEAEVDLCEFEATLVYRESFRIARAALRNTV